jgi:hypothetical protein
LNFALDKLGPDAKAWLLPVKNADKIPSVGAEYFKVAHRDRLAWHILHAQQIAEAEPDVPDADEPVPADVHDGHRTGMMAEQNADSVRQSDSTLWSFEHFFHIDKANACMHCAPVRFSPITFRLLADLLAMWSDDEDITQEMAEVKYHQGQYELDPGR